MKVAYVLHTTDPLGGSTKSFLAMLRVLIRKGVEPLVIVPDGEGVKVQLDEMGVSTVVLNYRPNIYPKHQGVKNLLLWLPRLAYHRYLNFVAARQLKGYLSDADIVHTNVSVVDIGQRAARALGIPHIYHFREYGDKDFDMHYYPSKVAFAKTVTNSICITHDIQRHHELESDERSRVIYNPIVEVGTPVCSAGDIPSTPYFLFAGRLEPAKGLEDLIEAYKLSGVSTPLLVAGSANQADYHLSLLELVKREGVADSIKFLGNRNDITTLMHHATALIVPSLFEGFGRCMPEAMVQRCLVIGRNTGGTKEQFDNGVQLTGKEIGWRFDTIDQLAHHLASLEHLPADEAESYRQRALDVVNSLYTSQASSDSILRFYQHIL